MTLKRGTAYLLVLVMLVTLMPHTYYAASWNYTNKVLTVMNGEKISLDEAPILSMKLMNPLEENAIFYLELVGGEWIETPYSATIEGYSGNGFIEIKALSKQKLQVKMKGDTVVRGVTLQIPLPFQMTGQTAIVSVRSNNTVVTEGSYKLAQASSYKGQVHTGHLPTTTSSGVMADLVISEPFSKAFSKAVATGKSRKVELRLNHNAYAFSLLDSHVKLALSEGFEELSGEDFAIEQIDPQTLLLTLPDTSAARYTGCLTLSGIFIQLTDKKAMMDTLTVTVSGDLIEKSTVEVLEVMDYAIALKGKSDKAYAGSRQKVKFALEEQVEDSLMRNRPTYFSFSEGIILELVNQKVPVTLNGRLGYYPAITEQGKVVGFEVSRLPEELTHYEMEVEVVILPTASGHIKVKAEGRSLVEDLSLNILEVVRPFEVSVHGFSALVGVKDQMGGQVILKENAAGRLIQGEQIVLELEESNMRYSGLPQVYVASGDLRLGNAFSEGNRIMIPIVRSSLTPSTIVIRDFKVTVDQTIATGNYTLKVGGGALSSLATKEDMMPVREEKFIEVVLNPVQVPSKPNEGSIEPEQSRPESTSLQAIFTLGTPKYQVNQVEKLMDAVPYISSGRTMLPIKYVSEALGISSGAIKWNSVAKTVMIQAEKMIVLTLGSNQMQVGSEILQMAAAPEIVNGRTFVPVAEITRALNVETSWDHLTKQVTFKR